MPKFLNQITICLDIKQNLSCLSSYITLWNKKPLHLLLQVSSRHCGPTLHNVCQTHISSLKDVVYNAYNYFFSGKANAASSPDAFPVADRSLLLLLLLSTQFKDGSGERSELQGDATSEQDVQWASAYRQAIAEVSGDQGTFLISFIYCELMNWRFAFLILTFSPFDSFLLI